MGRPTKLTPELQENFINAVKVGVPYKHAAQGLGVHEATLYSWMRIGRETEEEPYHSFYHAVEKARGDQIKYCLARIMEAAGNGTWQAAAWMMERKYPEEFGRVTVEHRGNVNVNNQYQIAVKVAADEQALRKLHDTLRDVKSIVSNPGGDGDTDQRGALAAPRALASSGPETVGGGNGKVPSPDGDDASETREERTDQ